MTEHTRHQPGTFSWADLMTTDAKAAAAFYTGLFGWEAEEQEMDGPGNYTMMMKDGKAVCGLFEMAPEMKAQGVPPFWQAYVTVEDVDAAAAKATSLGATLMQPPMDVMTAGRMAVLTDPGGAALAIWQPKDQIGAEITDVPGTLCWDELSTRDTEASARFYGDLFGWAANTTPGAEGEPYTMLTLGERPVGGMLAIREEWGEVPPTWSVYFAVENGEAAVSKAKELGAAVDMGPMTAPGTGTFTLLRDPLNGHFFVIELEEMPA